MPGEGVGGADGLTCRGLAGSQRPPALHRADGEWGSENARPRCCSGQRQVPPSLGLKEKRRDGERCLSRKNWVVGGNVASGVLGRAESKDAQGISP